MNKMTHLLAVVVLLTSLLACSEDDKAAQQNLPVKTETVAVNKTAKAEPTVEENCEKADALADHLEGARVLSEQKYNPDSLACAASLYVKIANSSSKDIELQVEAMTVLEEVLFYLRVIQNLDLMGVDKLNSDRILEFGKSYLELAEAAFNEAGEDPRLMIHKALSVKESEGAYDVLLLEQAIAKEPTALSGLAQLRLGRLLFELPSILGGDFQVAIALLEQATEIDPQNMQALYYLAEVYEQEIEEGKAAQTMASMLEIKSVTAQLQMSTDMLRLAIGLAQRMRENELSTNLRQKRESILAANPELMTRVSIAVGGHGGEHPLTGTD
jgi:tetratricopeptide (TPR) repeat protein